jgi:hypothetical protein
MADKRELKVYVAGKVSKQSIFGKHQWRDEFCAALMAGNDLVLHNLDPTKKFADPASPPQVFGADCYLIKASDVVIVYLSDDISVGGSQEILIAKYLGKPVIGLAPLGGKFNGSDREHFERLIHDYHDPFVFSTCDVVCKDIEEVAQTLLKLDDMPRQQGIGLIDEALKEYIERWLPHDSYVNQFKA